jgi:hypothetical protein
MDTNQACGNWIVSQAENARINAVWAMSSAVPASAQPNHITNRTSDLHSAR